ncbi:MAG: amidohydrolase family protein [Candidatus Acidiferrales bacterium]
MRIDAHQHFWKFDPVRDAWITEEMGVLRRDFLPEDLAPELSANRMDASIAVQADQSEDETLFLLDLAEKHPQIAGVVGWVNFSAPNIRERLRYFSRFPKLRGFRHIVQAEPDDRFLLREDFLRGISCLKEFGFTYDVLIYPKQLPAAVEFVQRFPDQPFIVDHIAKPLVKEKEVSSWSKHMRALAAASNVSCKVSGLITEGDWKRWRPEEFHPYLDVVFDAFGPERLLFGSDWPVCLLAGTYHQVRQLVENYIRSRPQREKDNIFGGNAAHFYGVKPARAGARG